MGSILKCRVKLRMKVSENTFTLQLEGNDFNKCWPVWRSLLQGNYITLLQIEFSHGLHKYCGPCQAF